MEEPFNLCYDTKPQTSLFLYWMKMLFPLTWIHSPMDTTWSCAEQVVFLFWPDSPSIFWSEVKVKVKLLSRVRLFATPWTTAYQVPLSMGFSRQEYWSGVPFPSPGDLPNPGIEPSLTHCRQTLYRLSHQYPNFIILLEIFHLWASIYTPSNCFAHHHPVRFWCTSSLTV